MLFIHFSLLAGLGAVLIPVILHLWSRRKKTYINWAAVQFLIQSVDLRHKKIALEDGLLMAARCLLIGLAVLTVARPFVPDTSEVPWGIVLPLGLLAIGCLGATIAVWSHKYLRLLGSFITIIAIIATVMVVQSEHAFSKERLGEAGRQAVALVLDGSMSMTADRNGEGSSFSRAVSEARAMIERSEPGNRFAIFVGGHSIVDLTRGFTSDRPALMKTLTFAQPIGGSFHAFRATEVAIKQLQDENQSSGAKIVILTDGQPSGWATDAPERWAALERETSRLPNKPQIVLHRIDFPEPFRNGAITEIEITPAFVVKGHESTISVSLENTGKQAITPRGVRLSVAGSKLESSALDQIPSGAVTQVPFRFRFTESGPIALSAEILVEDDLQRDDTFDHVAFVSDGLGALVIDGQPDAPHFERGSTFLKLAMPQSDASEFVAPSLADSPSRINATFIDMDEVDRPTLMSGVNVIVLAAVDTLNESIAATIADFVKQGGGLLVFPGATADTKFYNTWNIAGQPVLPARMEKRQQFSRIRDGIRPQTSSIPSSLLGAVTDTAQSDLELVRISSYWKLSDAGTTAGSLSNGDPFLTHHQIGSGKVILAAMAMNAEDSNWVTRESFLPAMHELIHALAGESQQHELNLIPADPIRLQLSGISQNSGLESREQAMITRPDGSLQATSAAINQGTLSVEIPWSGIAGLHHLSLPQESSSLNPSRDFHTVTGSGVPFTIIREAAESQPDILDADAIAFIRQYMDVIETTTGEDALRVLAGKGAGEELWPRLLLAVLLLLLAETALCRWVARQRKIGHERHIPFGTPSYSARPE